MKVKVFTYKFTWSTHKIWGTALKSGISKEMVFRSKKNSKGIPRRRDIFEIKVYYIYEDSIILNI